MDENRNVPALVGEGADLAAEAAQEARQHALQSASTTDQEMDVDSPSAHTSYTTMVVVDGILISPPVCMLLNLLI